MSDPSDAHFGLGAILAGGAAVLSALGAAAAAALPKVQKAAEARHRARLERIREERALIRERAAFAAAHGDLDQWGPEHPVCQLLDRCRDALAVVDEGLYVWANSAFCNLLGFEPGDLAGTAWADRVAPESAADVAAARARVMGGKQLAGFRVRMVRRQGEVVAVRAYSTPGPGAQLIRLEPG